MAASDCLPGAGVSFGSGAVIAGPCGLSLTLPTINIDLLLPRILANINFPPKLAFNFSLNCNLSNPIDVSAGLDFGGGRISCSPPNPDDDPNL